jgi:histone H3/H4
VHKRLPQPYDEGASSGISKSAFKMLVEEIARSYASDIYFGGPALDALQAAAEEFLTKGFNSKQTMMQHWQSK